ncbi:toxin-antitoxin system TumE family protein [Geminicoccus flavidas]|uniref:toxin-antitoxin system TumE family protein n=1 Tax=Geminicoccus flavidas TaxID=2506407 RepID=UPI00135CF46D|nr:DUF6516 family protein [Geminicoccus flavidas]
MKAELLVRQRTRLADGMFVETVIWRVPEPVRGSAHGFKYRLALVVEGECVLRYDNEAGKGDHKHLGTVELPYRFRDLDELVDDFWRDVQGWRAS